MPDRGLLTQVIGRLLTQGRGQDPPPEPEASSSRSKKEKAKARADEEGMDKEKSKKAKARKVLNAVADPQDEEGGGLEKKTSKRRRTILSAETVGSEDDREVAEAQDQAPKTDEASEIPKKKKSKKVAVSGEEAEPQSVDAQLETERDRSPLKKRSKTSHDQPAAPPEQAVSPAPEQDADALRREERKQQKKLERKRAAEEAAAAQLASVVSAPTPAPEKKKLSKSKPNAPTIATSADLAEATSRKRKRETSAVPTDPAAANPAETDMAAEAPKLSAAEKQRLKEEKAARKAQRAELRAKKLERRAARASLAAESVTEPAKVQEPMEVEEDEIDQLEPIVEEANVSRSDSGAGEAVAAQLLPVSSTKEVNERNEHADGDGGKKKKKTKKDGKGEKGEKGEKKSRKARISDLPVTAMESESAEEPRPKKAKKAKKAVIEPSPSLEPIGAPIEVQEALSMIARYIGTVSSSPAPTPGPSHAVSTALKERLPSPNLSKEPVWLLKLPSFDSATSEELERLKELEPLLARAAEWGYADARPDLASGSGNLLMIQSGDDASPATTAEAPATTSTAPPALSAPTVPEGSVSALASASTVEQRDASPRRADSRAPTTESRGTDPAPSVASSAVVRNALTPRKSPPKPRIDPGNIEFDPDEDAAARARRFSGLLRGPRKSLLEMLPSSSSDESDSDSDESEQREQDEEEEAEEPRPKKSRLDVDQEESEGESSDEDMEVAKVPESTAFEGLVAAQPQPQPNEARKEDSPQPQSSPTKVSTPKANAAPSPRPVENLADGPATQATPNDMTARAGRRVDRSTSISPARGIQNFASLIRGASSSQIPESVDGAISNAMKLSRDGTLEPIASQTDSQYATPAPPNLEDNVEAASGEQPELDDEEARSVADADDSRVLGSDPRTPGREIVIGGTSGTPSDRDREFDNEESDGEGSRQAAKLTEILSSPQRDSLPNGGLDLDDEFDELASQTYPPRTDASADPFADQNPFLTASSPIAGRSVVDRSISPQRPAQALDDPLATQPVDFAPSGQSLFLPATQTQQVIGTPTSQTAEEPEQVLSLDQDAMPAPPTVPAPSTRQLRSRAKVSTPALPPATAPVTRTREASATPKAGGAFSTSFGGLRRGGSQPVPRRGSVRRGLSQLRAEDLKYRPPPPTFTQSNGTGALDGGEAAGDDSSSSTEDSDEEEDGNSAKKSNIAPEKRAGVATRRQGLGMRRKSTKELWDREARKSGA